MKQPSSHEDLERDRPEDIDCGSRKVKTAIEELLTPRRIMTDERDRSRMSG